MFIYIYIYISDGSFKHDEEIDLKFKSAADVNACLKQIIFFFFTAQVRIVFWTTIQCKYHASIPPLPGMSLRSLIENSRSF